MKIATFNINNVNRRLPNLLRWLRAAKPDVVCLQELKSTDAEFPIAAIEKAGYGAVWRGQKTWNGVAILARNAEPVLTRTALPGDRDDDEARYIEAAVNGVIVTSIYLPNGNPQPGPKFDYKLDWFKRLRSHAGKLLKQDIPVVLAGDYNVAPTASDIYPTKSWDKDALIQPKSRAAFKALVDQGWTDAIRTLHPSKPMFTFWDYKRNRWPRDAGLRLDHLLLSPTIAPRLLKAGVDRKVRGEEGASDHAPAWIVLALSKLFSRVSPGRVPILARGVDDAAIGLEELVRHLEDREHQPALRTPGDVAAALLAPDEFAGLAFDALRRAFLVDERTFQHIGLLDIDVLVVGQHRARREPHQRGHQPGLAIEQQRLGFAAGETGLLPFHAVGANEMGMRVCGLRRHGVHGGPPFLLF